MNINCCYLIKKMYLSIYVIFIFGVLTLAGCSAAPNFHIQSNQYKSSLDYLKDDTHCLKQARIASNRYLGRRDFQIIRERIYVKCMANQGNVVLLKDDASEEAIAWVKDEEAKRHKAELAEQKAEEEIRERRLAEQKAEEEAHERKLAEQEAKEEARKNAEVAQRDTASLAKYASWLDKIVEADSYGWLSNQYDPGSMKNILFLSKSPDGENMVIKGDYTYNDGAEGSVEIRIVNGRISCLKYWDMRDCRPLNSDPDSIREKLEQQKKKSSVAWSKLPPNKTMNLVCVGHLNDTVVIKLDTANRHISFNDIEANVDLTNVTDQKISITVNSDPKGRACKLLSACAYISIDRYSLAGVMSFYDKHEQLKCSYQDGRKL